MIDGILPSIDNLLETDLETLAQESVRLTRQRFGHTIQLYAPLYLSSECVNHCTYCGFSTHNRSIPRRTLSPEEIRTESRALASQGIRHVLLVAGEHPKHVSVPYLESCVRAARPLFSSLSLEVAPLTTEEYRPLVEAGASGLVVYQETYDREAYRTLHLAGPKKNYDDRLETALRGARAGMRTVGLGFLLGLAPWKQEWISLMEHARQVQSQAWQCQLAFSFPRLRAAEGVQGPRHPVSDAELTRLICLTRIQFPESMIVLSTRESPALRDALAPLGVTQMSAGSRTMPGGYALGQEELEQFEVSDERSVHEVREALRSIGLEAVDKDWERDLVGPVR
ncbi:MAG: 2-iminoacetate synthase ThiH [Planctomycetota bacterium]